MSATPHRRVVRVIGPIWPTANRPTIECPAQIRVVRTSSRIGLAQADCISPALGAVASVIKVFGGLERVLRAEARPALKPSAPLGKKGAGGHRPSRPGRQPARSAAMTPLLALAPAKGYGNHTCWTARARERKA